MLGTYTVNGDVPAEPEIVLANCTDATMVNHLVSAFGGNPDIRFFMLENVDADAIDLNAAFHFLKDNGNWVLANHNTLLEVLFDDPDFNPDHSGATFSQAEDGTWSVFSGTESLHAASTLPGEEFLLDMGDKDLFTDHAPLSVPDTEPATFFVDPSLLPQGETEILVTNFTLGHDTLELPDHLEVKDVVVDADHDLTQVILQGEQDDIVVKLMGVHQPDFPDHDFAMTADAGDDNLIGHMIHSGQHQD